MLADSYLLQKSTCCSAFVNQLTKKVSTESLQEQAAAMGKLI